MKILIVIPTLRRGGAERVVANLSSELTNRGYDVMIVTFSKGEIDYPVKQLREIAIEPSTNIIKKILNVLRRALQLRIIKKEFLPDVSLSFMFGANLVNLLSRIRNDIVISSVRNTIKFDAFSIRVINLIIFKLSDTMVVVSKGIKTEIVNRYKLDKEKVYVINNFIKLNADSQYRQITGDEIQLITMGRLVDAKAQWHLIHVVNQLKSKYPRIKLNILGEGPLFQTLLELIKELGVEDNIHLLGFQKETYKYLNEATIFCFSSRNEGMPNALLEAMSVGLPVVSTDIPHGPKDILNPLEINLYNNDGLLTSEKYGLLVDCGNNPNRSIIGYRDEYIVNQFIEKIELLMNNKEVYSHYSRQSLKRVKDFSGETIVKQWVEIFESLSH